jgi:hypothetical protein
MIIAMVAMGIIALALGYFVHPAYATTGTKVDIHQDLPILSDGFTEDADCGDATSGVVWHFVLVNYDGTDAQLFGEFTDAGTFGPIDPADKPSTSIHFYVTTPTDDELIDAYVMLGGTVASNTQLQLSHVCHAGEAQSVAESASAESIAESVPESISESVPESVSESVPASAEQSVAASGEQSVEAGTGTPAASVSNGALSLNGVGALPTIAFSLILLASLGALAYANVKSVRS